MNKKIIPTKLLKYLTPAAMLINFCTSVQAVECKVPKFSSEQIIHIVQQERVARTDLPKEIPNSTKNVYPHDRCYYTYHESSREDFEYKYVFILNENGVIVDLKLHHVESHMKCPAPDPTLDFLASRLKVLREQEPTLPKQPLITYTTFIVKYGCTYFYTEENEDKNVSQTFLFDAFGGLRDYMSP